MRFLLGLIKLYSLLIIIWAVLTWIPGISGSAFHNFLGIPIIPVLNLFSFASVSIGGLGVGLQAIIVLLILYGLEHVIEKYLLPQEERFDRHPHDQEHSDFDEDEVGYKDDYER